MKRAGRDFHIRTLPLAAVSPRRRIQEPRRTPRSQSQFSLRAQRALRLNLVIAAVAVRAHSRRRLTRCRSATSTCGCEPDAIEGTHRRSHLRRRARPEHRAGRSAARSSGRGQHSAALANLLAASFTVTADGRTLTPQWSAVEVVADRQSLRFPLRYPLAAPPGRLGVTAVMFPYDPQHQTFLNIYEGDALTQAILDRGRTVSSSTSPARARARSRSCRRFLPAGIHHILIGPDHLLFLVGLLLLGGTVRQLARRS